MSDEKVNIEQEISEDDQKRIAACYTKTVDHYGELPYDCKDCCDFNVCFILDEQNIITIDKGVE